MWRPAAPLLFLFFSPLIAGAQSTPRSLLWSVRTPMGSPSYLYGTFHSRDARVFRFQDSVLVALEACDIMAGELEVEQTRHMDHAITNAMLLPSGGSLDRLYNKRDYRLVIEALKERLGPLAPVCTKLRPFYTVAMLSEMELGNDSATVLDAWLQEHAQAMGKRIAGLETIAEQLAAVERIPLREQARLLYEVVIRDSSHNDMSEAMNAYAARDLDALMGIVGRDGMPEHADKALLEERNGHMADRLEKFMSGGHRVFAAVGAAHLAGDDGLIALLRARGYLVEPVAPDVQPAPCPAIPTPPPGPPVLPPSIALKKGVHFRNDTLGFAVDMPRAPVKRVVLQDDSLRIISWSSAAAQGDQAITVTVSEGTAISRTDARTRIEGMRSQGGTLRDDPKALTRIDGFQAFESTGTTAEGLRERRVTVATPMRDYVFAVPVDKRDPEDFMDRVIRSIRIAGAEQR